MHIDMNIYVYKQIYTHIHVDNLKCFQFTGWDKV